MSNRFEDMPIIQELAQEAISALKASPTFQLSVADVIEFLDIERRKEDERQVRELLNQRQGKRYAVFPELRSLLDRIAGGL